MQRYFSSQPKNSYQESNFVNQVVLPTSENQALPSSSQPQESRFTDESKVDLKTLEADPGLRKRISDFHPNIQDEALQKNDQDILNALALVEIAKERLQEMRDDGWEGILNEVVLFCNKRDIDLPNMNEQYVKGKRSTRQAPIVTNLHHYKYDCLHSVIDSQLKELNCRFDVASTELLSCVACLHPSSSFEAFNKQSLIRLTVFYPDDFSNVDVVVLDNQLENYIRNVRSDNRFHGLKGLVDLSRKLVQTKMHKTYPFVYRLVKLALILPVATASVERVFSAMNFIKTASRNKMCDQWLQDCLVTFIERDVFNSISNDVIVNRFQSMKT